MASSTVIDRLRPGDHICWMFDDDQRRLATVARYVQAGLRRHEKLLYFTDSIQPTALLAGLEAHGVDVDGRIAKGQLRVAPAVDGYLSDGRFDPKAMIESWVREIATARREGWAGLRVTADMAWVLRSNVDTEQLAWYEAHVSRVFADGFTTVLCQYDQRRFAAAELRQVSAAHPGMIPVGVDGDWEPLLRMARTTDPPGLRLSGEVDLSNREALAAMLHDAIEELGHRGAELVVDVTGLRFADTGAANLLLTAARAHPAGLSLTGCSAALARLLDLTDSISGAGGAGARGLRVVMADQAS
jgi:anti-anti-sigma factor